MSPRSIGRALLLVMLAAAGCGSSGAPSDAGDAAPEPCGEAAPCLSDQLCVSHQDCTAPTCTPADGGVCPAGTSATASCPGSGQPGCLGGCIVSFACEARPAGCATLSCACAAALCAPDTCLTTMGIRVACAAQ